MARDQKTSFNILTVPVAKYGSAYMHQKPEHRETLNYIHSERTHLNERWDKETQANGRPKTLKNYLSDTKKIVKQKTGRAMQKRAEDNVIGEAVVVIDEHTTMEELQKLGKAMEERYGWTCVQIHIHRDEGYLGKRTEEMKHREGKYNLHAHIFFITTNLENGKSWKRKKGEGSVMQDITAQTLNLTRGQKKSERTDEVKETLNVIEFKEEQARKKVEVLEQKIEQQGKELEEVKKGAKIATDELKEVKAGILSAEGRKAEIEQITNDLEQQLEEVEHLKQIDVSEIIEQNTKNTLFTKKVDYKEVAQELSRQQAEREKSLFAIEKKQNRELRKKLEEAQSEIREKNRRIEQITNEYKTFKEKVINALGDRFKRFWQDMKRYKENLLMAVSLWGGETWENKYLQEEYTADKLNCLLRINGKTIDQREKEFNDEVQRVYRIAVEKSGKGWADYRFTQLAKKEGYNERMRELKDIENTAQRSRGIRR